MGRDKPSIKSIFLKENFQASDQKLRKSMY